jgi:hypothetical protein
VQIISGRRDAVVPLVNAEHRHRRLPHSELRVVDSGHFLWEDAADEHARLVNACWVSVQDVSKAIDGHRRRFLSTALLGQLRRRGTTQI